jgi:hypothetical protein
VYTIDIDEESKKNTQEIDIMRESVISLSLLVVVLCGYQIYQFLKLVYDLFFLSIIDLRYESEYNYIFAGLWLLFLIDLF